jgi:hypothetical protein
MPPYTFGQTAKTWTATTGAIATALLVGLAGHTKAGRALAVVTAVGTAAAVYAVPNTPTHDAAEISPVHDPPADSAPAEHSDG